MSNFLRWGRAAAAAATVALGAAGCASVERSDVEKWYRDGEIDQATYMQMMQKIDAGQNVTRPSAPTPATPPASPPPP